MSHRKLLLQRLTESIERGDYRAKGSPRPARAATDREENAPAPAPKAEPEKRQQPPTAQKSGTPDPKSYVEGLAARRRDSVGDSVHKALDERFRGKK